MYCSEQCLQSDALLRHPLLGYEYSEFKQYPKSTGFINDKHQSQQSSGITSSISYNHNVALYKSSTSPNMTNNTFALPPFNPNHVK